MISGSGVEENIVARIRCGWKKFMEHLPALTSQVIFTEHKR